MFKHERITLVVLGYIIGFVTAYIAFAISDHSNNYHHYKNNLNSERHQKQSKINYNNQANPVTDLRRDGLYILKGQDERLISAQAISSQPQPGFHYRVVATLVSPSGNYIHFCSQNTETDDVCEHYIYSVADDVNYVVSDMDSNHIKSILGDTEVEWLDSGRLRIGQMESLDSNTPWKLKLIE